MDNEVVIHGWDLSLGHCGMVELDGDGDLAWYKYVIETQSGAKKSKRGVHLPWERLKKESQDKQQAQLKRLIWWKSNFDAVVVARKPTHVGIEDYAYASQSNSTYQIGELGGIARLAVLGYANFDRAYSMTKLRLHDPLSVKMFVTHNGNATPEEVAEAVQERWPLTKAWNALPKMAVLDLCVAYGLAQLTLTEIQLRTGKIRLEDLAPKEVQVFTRCTKTYPTNLLGREFLTQ